MNLTYFQQTLTNCLMTRIEFGDQAKKDFDAKVARYGLGYAIDWLTANRTMVLVSAGAMAQDLLASLNVEGTGTPESDLAWKIKGTRYYLEGVRRLMENSVGGTSNSLYSTGLLMDRTQALSELIRVLSCFFGSTND